MKLFYFFIIYIWKVISLKFRPKTHNLTQLKVQLRGTFTVLRYFIHISINTHRDLDHTSFICNSSLQRSMNAERLSCF